jgi:hypothetical protein
MTDDPIGELARLLDEAGLLVLVERHGLLL